VVIIQPLDSGSKSHAFPHALVAGIERYPSQVTRRMSKARQAKRSRVKPFIKIINYNHLMPTRYTLELEGLKNVITNDTFKEVSQREEAKKTVKKSLEERYTTGKNRWFFTPLSDSAIPGQWINSRSTPLNPVSDIPITVLGCQQNGTIHKDLQQHAAPVDKDLSTIQISLLLPSSPINPGWERYGSSFCPPEAMLLPNKIPKRTSKLKQSAAIPNHILRTFPSVVNCKEHPRRPVIFKFEAFDAGPFRKKKPTTPLYQRQQESSPL
ncbi:MAG: hypothetical protein Q9177_001568, partial [Variospora cf. flavescens]